MTRGRGDEGRAAIPHRLGAQNPVGQAPVRAGAGQRDTVAMRSVVGIAPSEDLLPYARSWDLRCKARLERGNNHGHHGRCDLKRGHRGVHVLERGMEIVRFAREDAPGALYVRETLSGVDYLRYVQTPPLDYRLAYVALREQVLTIIDSRDAEEARTVRERLDDALNEASNAGALKP